MKRSHAVAALFLLSAVWVSPAAAQRALGYADFANPPMLGKSSTLDDAQRQLGRAIPAPVEGQWEFHDATDGVIAYFEPGDSFIVEQCSELPVLVPDPVATLCRALLEQNGAQSLADVQSLMRSGLVNELDPDRHPNNSAADDYNVKREFDGDYRVIVEVRRFSEYGQGNVEISWRPAN